MRRLIRWIRQQDRIDELVCRLAQAQQQVLDAYQEGKRGQGGLAYWQTQAYKDAAGLGEVAVYFTLGERPMVMASDKFDFAAANIRSLSLAIEAMRQLERHGGGMMMERAFNGFVALPAPASPWDLLGQNPSTSEAEIEAAYRRKAMAAHPDRPGGSHEAMMRLNEAQAATLGNAG